MMCAKGQGHAILSPHEDIQRLSGTAVLIPMIVIQSAFFCFQLIKGVCIHIGLAVSHHSVGCSVKEIDSHVRAHTHIDPDEALASVRLVVGDVVDHLCVPQDVRIIGLSFFEVDHHVAPFHLVELLRIQLLDAERVAIEVSHLCAG